MLQKTDFLWQMRCLAAILFILFIVPGKISAQQEPVTNRSVEELIEEIAGNTDADLDYSMLYDDLTYYQDNPLNLNKATREELEKLHVLSDYMIDGFLNYRTQYGQIYSIYELQVINGFTQEIIEMILPFITLSGNDAQMKFPLKKSLTNGSHQIFLRAQQILEPQKGFSPITDSALWASPNSRYLGNSQKYWIRYQYSYKNFLNWGLTAEKDPGEVFFKNNVNDSIQKLVGNKLHNGFDFYSAHIFIQGLGWLKTLALGDYLAQFGQGLTMWSGIGYGKSSYVLSVKRRPMGIKKYSSVDENLFLRGGAAVVRFGDLDITAFYSRKKIDAHVTALDTVSDEVLEISSLELTGLHTTPAELADKHSITEEIEGGNISYNREHFRLGLTGVHYSYSAALTTNQQPYNQFDFNGSENTDAGIDYQFSLKDINFFGETSGSENGGFATLNGAVFNLCPQVSFSVIQRNYDRNYQAGYGCAFGENSKNANENGLFFGTTVYPVRKWKLSAYYDSYKFPWLRYQADAPSSGYDWFVQADYSLSSKVSMYWKVRQKVKPENQTADATQIPVLAEVNNIRLRYDLCYQVTRTIQLRNRIELAFYQKGDTASPEKGIMVYQDIIYKSVKTPFSVSLRYGIFGTDSYNSGIFTYEDDVLNSYSIPCFYSKGARYYIMFQYALTKNIEIWLRFAQTFMRDQNVISSGLTEIDGNKKSEVKIQVRIRF